MNNNFDLNQLIDKFLEAKTKYIFVSLDKIAPDFHVQTARILQGMIDEKKYEIIPLDYRKDIFLSDYEKQEFNSRYINFKTTEEKEKIIKFIKSHSRQVNKKQIFIINNIDLVLSYFKSRNNDEFNYFWELLINNSIYSQVCIFLVTKHLSPSTNTFNYTHFQCEFKNLVEKLILENLSYA